ncbi:MAG TPA: succinate dehydrogenase assembly factor 2 [Steroidobacteraceae bacterium]
MNAVTSAGCDAQARRLLWRCRRGMKELDVMLERFARATLPGAGAEERALLSELLAQPDPLLAAWLLGEATPPQARLAGLTARIRALCRSGGAAAVF